ncbi:MAG: diguanylate cyclase [Chloroflexota bacterium]
MTGPQEAGLAERVPPRDANDPHAHDGAASTLASSLYQRMVRVVSYLFIAAVAAIVTLTGGPTQAAVYVLLVVGIILLVLFQDLLPTSSLARWRLPLEGAATITFVTVLLILTGGYRSPFFFGYILLLGAGSLWATGLGPPILAGVTALAYLVAVAISSGPTLLTAEAIGRVAFNVVALGLVTYVAWVIGREQRRAREEALRLSRFDPLTGLYSRSFFTSTVEREIPRAARTGRPFAMLMFDLDGLKAANDRFGHDSGDRLLQSVADVFRGDIRVTDVAARYAGDEFLLLLPETDLPGALRVAEKVRVDVSRLALPHDGSLIRTSASIGLVTFPDDGRTWAELMRRADLAMYEAKRRGRDQIVHYARTTASRPPQPAATGPPHIAVGPGPPLPGVMEPPTQAPPQAPGPVQPQGQPEARAQPQPPVAEAPFQQTTTGVPFDIPPESPHPAPWETSGG